MCIRPLQRTLFAALGCLLVAGSCAVDDVAPTVTPAGCSDGPEACESTPSLDEIRGLAKSLGSEEFSQAMADLYGPLAALGGGCENFSGWADDVSVVTTLLDDASGLVEQVDSADTARMSDADRLARWVEQALLLDVVCDDANAEADKTLVSSAGAVGAADRFRFALTGYQNTSLGSRFWSFYEQPGHVAEALRLVDDYGNVDIVLTGDSSVKWAFDPLALSESTREIAVNFSADGLPATLYGRWLDDLEGLGVLPRAVVVGVSSWGTLISCTDQRIEAYDAASVARSASFEFVEALAETNPMLRASGGRTRQYASPLLERFDSSNVADGQGLVARDETTSHETDEGWLTAYVRQFAQPQPCEDNAEAIGELAIELSERGVALYVVAMPLSKEMTALHPEGRAGHLALVEVYEKSIAGTDAVFIDLTDALDPDEFWGLVHASDSGRRRLTTLLSDALKVP